MNKSNVKWVFLALVAILLLFCAAHKPLPAPKAQAQRIATVNNLASASITLSSTNVQPAATSNK